MLSHHATISCRRRLQCSKKLFFTSQTPDKSAFLSCRGSTRLPLGQQPQPTTHLVPPLSLRVQNLLQCKAKTRRPTARARTATAHGQGSLRHFSSWYSYIYFTKKSRKQMCGWRGMGWHKRVRTVFCCVREREREREMDLRQCGVVVVMQRIASIAT